LQLAAARLEMLPDRRRGLALGVDRRPQFLSRPNFLGGVAFGRVVAGPLFGELLRLGADLGPHPLQPCPQRGQHRLLALDL
jgi:hypothetical protein